MTYHESLGLGTVSDVLLGSTIGVLLAFGILMILLFVVAAYVYFAIAWQTIARKLNYKKPGLAWIPIVNLAVILQLGKFHWAWILLIFIPVVGWIALFVLLIIATWRVFEAMSYPGWFSLSMVIPQVGFILYFIAIGFVAWADKKPKRVASG